MCDSNKSCLKGAWEVVDWVFLAGDRYEGHTFMNTIVNLHIVPWTSSLLYIYYTNCLLSCLYSKKKMHVVVLLASNENHYNTRAIQKVTYVLKLKEPK
jgi:hypothetical protein